MSHHGHHHHVHHAPPLALVPREHDIHSTRVLSLDANGRILDWMSWQDAVCLYVREAVAWTVGDPCLTIHGGTCRATGRQSLIDLHPIVASRGHARPGAYDPCPPLTNTAMFARDRQLCLYCGEHFPRNELTRDHVVPLSKGGRDRWENVVSACLHCNVRKGGRTPHEANMHLIKVPVKPKRSPLLTIKLGNPKYASWKTFLDNAYWSVDLK